MSATVSQVLGGNASPIVVSIGGKEYSFSLVTQKAKSSLERAIQDRARKELIGEKNDLSDEEFRLAYGAFIDRVSSGAFAFGGPICRQFLTSTAGLESLLKILANIQPEEAGRLMIEYAEEVGQVIGQVFTESFQAARKKAELPST